LIGCTRCFIQLEFTEDPPVAKVEAFFKLLKAPEEPLHEHIEVTLLDFMIQLVTIKSFFSNNCYNELIKLISDILSKPHKVPKDMYKFKKMLSGQITACFFWKEHAKER
jgi:hypothetical protein